MSVLIAPSILSADLANLAYEVKQAEDAMADWIHVDVMDGHFVPNLTIGAPVVASIRAKCSIPLDVHLMISNPDKYLVDFAKAGSTYLTVHVEACIHLHRTLVEIRKLGMKAGVALNPATPPEYLRYVLPYVDLVLLMTVNPGFGGQSFIDSTIPKIQLVRSMLDSAHGKTLLAVDGGIGPNNAELVTAAGANVLVAGKSIYGSGNVAQAIKDLRNKVSNVANQKTA